MMSRVSRVARTAPWPGVAWSEWAWVIERAGDGADGVDVEAARGAVEALGAGDEEVGGAHGEGVGRAGRVAKGVGGGRGGI